MAPQSIFWQTTEFRHYPKNIGWYITLACVGVLLIGFFILEKDIFGAVTTALLCGLVFFFASQKPNEVTVELTNKALKFGLITYPYKQLKSFWIVNTKHHNTVNFTASTYVNNTVVVQLEDEDPDEVREFLLQYLPEHHETEPTFSQKISHKLKF
jgi:hypothetical protein